MDTQKKLTIGLFGLSLENIRLIFSVADGGFCALTRTAATARPAARTRTPILVVSGAGQREYELAGVVKPDAFTQDATGLFVLEWLPPFGHVAFLTDPVQNLRFIVLPALSRKYRCARRFAYW